ncbi:unnamed protein product, partial [Allacma fusca]
MMIQIVLTAVTSLRRHVRPLQQLRLLEFVLPINTN